MKEHAKKLAAEHWEYVESVIRNEYYQLVLPCGEQLPEGEMFDLDAYCRRVGHHFQTAFIHGFKHGVEYKGGAG